MDTSSASKGRLFRVVESCSLRTALHIGGTYRLHLQGTAQTQLLVSRVGPANWLGHRLSRLEAQPTKFPEQTFPQETVPKKLRGL
jgi:hypothetical protein